MGCRPGGEGPRNLGGPGGRSFVSRAGTAFPLPEALRSLLADRPALTNEQAVLRPSAPSRIWSGRSVAVAGRAWALPQRVLGVPDGGVLNT
jgi:hypothetical protein